VSKPCVKSSVEISEPVGQGGTLTRSMGKGVKRAKGANWEGGRPQPGKAGNETTMALYPRRLSSSHCPL
jgi:hypothetical protein